MRYHRRALIGIAALLAAACVDQASGPRSTPLSDADAQLIGHEVAGEVEDVAGTFTLGGLFAPEFPSAGLVMSDSDRIFPHANCPTITPFPPVDSDGDGVPDDVTLAFTLPDCSFTRDRATLEITGTIHITDPSTTAFGVRVAFGDFQHKATSGDGSFFLTKLNGVRQALRSPAGFELRDSTTADRESSDHGSAQLAKAWVVSFVADAGQTVEHMRGLPSGDLSVNGSMTRTRGTTSLSLAVTTVTPLHHDATCAARPRFTSGELLITRTGPDGTTTIHLVFSGCGVPPTITVEHSAA